MVVVDSHVGVEESLEVGDLGVIDVIFIYFFGDDVEPDVIFFLEHDLHLVKDELQFLTFVHRSVGFHLHFLQNVGSFQNVIIIFFALHDQHYASCVFHLNPIHNTSRKIFLALTSRIVSMSLVRCGSEMLGSQVMAN